MPGIWNGFSPTKVTNQWKDIGKPSTTLINFRYPIYHLKRARGITKMSDTWKLCKSKNSKLKNKYAYSWYTNRIWMTSLSPSWKLRPPYFQNLHAFHDHSFVCTCLLYACFSSWLLLSFYLYFLLFWIFLNYFPSFQLVWQPIRSKRPHASPARLATYCIH